MAVAGPLHRWNRGLAEGLLATTTCSDASYGATPQKYVGNAIIWTRPSDILRFSLGANREGGLQQPPKQLVDMLNFLTTISVIYCRGVVSSAWIDPHSFHSQVRLPYARLFHAGEVTGDK